MSERFANATPRPWFVRDFRASEMRRLGWVGPAIDRILITNKTGPEIEASSGADCVVARVQFDNRPEELTDSNFADAELIVEAVNTYDSRAALIAEMAGALENSRGAIIGVKDAFAMVGMTLAPEPLSMVLDQIDAVLAKVEALKHEP